MAIRTRSAYRYTADDGELYSVVLADDIGLQAGLGFTVADGTEQPKPAALKMRYVLMTDPLTGRQRKRPCGTLAAAAYATPLVGSYSLDQWNDTTNVSYVVTFRAGETFHYDVRPVPA